MATVRSVCLAAVALASAPGCDDGGVAPLANVRSTTPDMIDPSRDDADDLSIIIEYHDPDGDLGEGIAEVHDCRAEGVVIVYDIPGIASEEAVDEGVPIEGELELIVNDIGAIDADSGAPEACAALGVLAPVEGQARFCVILTDAAGNLGEGDCTAPVAILAPE